MVDDLSTDVSVDIIKGFCEKDFRFSLLQTPAERKGGSSARNIGLEHAQG